MDSAFAYMIAKQDGLDDTESAYPYKGTDGSCSFKATVSFVCVCVCVSITIFF